MSQCGYFRRLPGGRSVSVSSNEFQETFLGIFGAFKGNYLGISGVLRGVSGFLWGSRGFCFSVSLHDQQNKMKFLSMNVTINSLHSCEALSIPLNLLKPL